MASFWVFVGLFANGRCRVLSILMKADGRYTARVLDWLTQGQTARVSHRFERVVNLVNQDGRLISLHTAAVGMGPFSWEIPADILARLDLLTPIDILPRGEGLRLGSARLVIRPGRLWPARPDWGALASAPLPLPDHKIEAVIWKPFTRLIGALVAGDREKTLAAVSVLAGRGAGVTPTGDDLIMGLCYALWVRGWEPGWMALLAGAAAPLTTTISAEFLLAAAGGEATIHWHRLAAGDPAAPAEIWRIGHTSGRDAWTGFRYGLGRLDDRVRNPRS